MSKYLSVFIISVSALFSINAIKSCESRDNISGDCVELKYCPVLYERYLLNRYDSNLRKFACGHSNSDVCCPLTSATESIATTLRPTTTRKTTTSTTPRPTTTITRKTTTSTTPSTIQRDNVLLPILLPEPTDISSIKYHRNFGLINSKKCGSNSGDRIYDGKKTSLYEYKWNVLLQFKSTLGDELLKFMCGGTLIADQYVLSAAHCVINAKEKGYELFSVRVGEWDLSTEKDCVDNEACAPPVQDIKVEKYKLHGMYNDALSVNDIMMIKLEHKVTYDRNVKTICLPTNENELITKTIEIKELVISGWGKTEHKKASDVLLFAEVPYLPLDGCKQRMKEDRIPLILYESHICAGGADLKDSCSGDSGGPLAGGIEKSKTIPIKMFQFGIVSVGVGCRGQGVSPGIYTNVAYYMKWILDQMDQ
ncbi:unnamed protein product [Diamesa tonsa]